VAKIGGIAVREKEELAIRKLGIGNLSNWLPILNSAWNWSSLKQPSVC